jgi:hypothetical protein
MAQILSKMLVFKGFVESISVCVQPLERQVHESEPPMSPYLAPPAAPNSLSRTAVARKNPTLPSIWAFELTSGRL